MTTFLLIGRKRDVDREKSRFRLVNRSFLKRKGTFRNRQFRNAKSGAFDRHSVLGWSDSLPSRPSGYRQLGRRSENVQNLNGRHGMNFPTRRTPVVLLRILGMRVHSFARMRGVEKQPPLEFNVFSKKAFFEGIRTPVDGRILGGHCLSEPRSHFDDDMRSLILGGGGIGYDRNMRVGINRGVGTAVT